MRDSVRAAFLDFTSPLEGVVSFFYQDLKGLVSIGIGDLVDPIRLAMGLPMVRMDGTPATQNEIAAEWLRIKQLPNGAIGGWKAAARVATLRLTDEGVRNLVIGKLNENDRAMSATFPAWEEWPADSQLGTLSMCWACGSGFPATWPKFTAALRAQDWSAAARECFMPEEAKYSGLRPRNRADAMLFRNAATVAAGEMDPDVLHWPTDLSEEPTQPNAVPTRRPPRIQDFALAHPDIPLDHPDLDDDEPPPRAA